VRGAARVGVVIAGLATAIGGLAGCARMNAALGQQWIVVQFAPGTSVATARQVTSACSRVPHLHLIGPVKGSAARPGVVDSVRYDATAASNADEALLERCLLRFRSAVAGETLVQPGD
jgi:hypothetical protein